MNTYKVTISFEAILFASVDSSSISKLPTCFRLDDVTVSLVQSEDSEDNVYSATLPVTAYHVSDAKKIAVEKLREILSLFAVDSLGFVISSNHQIVAEKVKDVIGAFELSEHIGIVKIRENVEPEIKALSWRDNWPEWLQTAIELNYLAVTSRDIKSAFIVYYSALEVLLNGIEGSPMSLLSNQLGDRYEEFKGNLRGFLHNYSLSEEHINRVTNQAFSTYERSTVDRYKNLFSKFKDFGLNFNEKQIGLVVEQRGSIVHTGESTDLNKVYGDLREWVQSIHVPFYDKK